MLLYLRNDYDLLALRCLFVVCKQFSTLNRQNKYLTLTYVYGLTYRVIASDF